MYRKNKQWYTITFKTYFRRDIEVTLKSSLKHETDDIVDVNIMWDSKDNSFTIIAFVAQGVKS